MFHRAALCRFIPHSILESISEVTRLSRLTSHEPRTRPLSRGASRALEEARGTHEPPGETFPQLVSFFRILGVARKNAAFECLGAIWCDMERMVPDECMVLEKYPIGSLVYVLMPAQIYGLACIIDIRGSGIGREVKVRFFKSRSNLELPDAWILERSRRLELFSRYHQDDEIDVVP